MPPGALSCAVLHKCVRRTTPSESFALTTSAVRLNASEVDAPCRAEGYSLLTNSNEYRQAIQGFERRKLRAWLWKYSRRWGALDGLLQESFKALLEPDATPVRIRDLDAFVRRVCARCANVWLKKLRHMAVLESRRDARGARNPTSPEHGVKLLQGLECVLKMANQLPRVQRQVYLLCDVVGYSTADVARKRGRRQATVKRTLYDARQSMRRKLRESLGDEQPSILAHFGLED